MQSKAISLACLLTGAITIRVANWSPVGCGMVVCHTSGGIVFSISELVADAGKHAYGKINYQAAHTALQTNAAEIPEPPARVCMSTASCRPSSSLLI